MLLVTTTTRLTLHSISTEVVELSWELFNSLSYSVFSWKDVAPFFWYNPFLMIHILTRFWRHLKFSSSSAVLNALFILVVVVLVLRTEKKGCLGEESINVLLIAKQETFKLLKRFSIAIIIYCRKSLGLAGPFLGEGFCCFSFIALPIKIGVLFIIPISITHRIWSLKNEIWKNGLWNKQSHKLLLRGHLLF